MKKIAIFFLIVIVIIVGISYMTLNYKAKYNNAKKANEQFVSYYNKEFQGYDLARIINKAYDNNLTGSVSRDENGKFIENDNNSIKIDIKILDTDKVYDMETLYSGRNG